MGKVKKDLVLGETTEEVTPETKTEKEVTTEEVTPEIVDVPEGDSEEVRVLKKQLADKDSQIKVLGSLTKSKTRGKVKKEVKTACGIIKIYDMS